MCTWTTTRGASWDSPGGFSYSIIYYSTFRASETTLAPIGFRGSMLPYLGGASPMLLHKTLLLALAPRLPSMLYIIQTRMFMKNELNHIMIQNKDVVTAHTKINLTASCSKLSKQTEISSMGKSWHKLYVALLCMQHKVTTLFGGSKSMFWNR